jgi:hypothetical protein
MKESVCACDACKKMCRTQPCIGTPDDIIKIVEAGYQDKLKPSIWMTGMATRTYHRPVHMLQPKSLEDGSCAFLDENNLCTLHDLRLKPTEGKQSLHSDRLKSIDEFKESANYLTAMSWIDENGYNDPIFELIKAQKKLYGNK